LILNSFMIAFLRIVVIRHHSGGTSMMNTLPKSLTIAFLAVSIFISGFNVDLVGAQNKAGEKKLVVELSDEERAWLDEHPEIVLGAPTSYPPMVIKRADGTHVGVLVDLFEQVSRRLNIRIRLHIEDSWADVQEKAQNGEIDGLAFGGRDPSRDALYNATDIVMPTYFSVFARSQNEYRLKRFSELKGMRIGYKRAARPTRSLLEKLPSTILKPYDSHESMTQALLSKEIDVIVAWMSYDHWRKERLQGTIDNILLIEEYPIEMVIYIRKEWPELIPILNKAIASLQQDALPHIIDKWFGQWPQRFTAAAEEAKIPRLNLTAQERAWLTQNRTVRVRIADWPPYLIVKGDEPPQGIVIEYLKLIGERTGVMFKHEVTDQPFA
jgi:ABC-type amino acid transport substrate-binding protein